MNRQNKIISLVALATVVLTSFSIQTTGKSITRKETVIAAWERARAYTKEYLDAATEEVYSFKPTPEMRTFAEQMLHLAVDNYKLVNASIKDLATPSNFKDLEKQPPLMTKIEITKAVMESYDFVIANIRNLDESKLDNTVKLFGKWETTLDDGLNKSFEHQTHHRGQTTVYLRLKGITPPKEKLI